MFLAYLNVLSLPLHIIHSVSRKCCFFVLFNMCYLLYLYFASRHYERYEVSKTIEERDGHPLIDR